MSQKICKLLLVFFCLSAGCLSPGFLQAADAEKEAPFEAAADAPEEDTPVIIEEIAGDMKLTGQRPWRKPDFSKQENFLGYSPTVFQVPKGLEDNYQFWLSIYTKYTTDQGVLHDAENMGFFYEALDFSTLSSRADLNPFKKERERTRLVKEAKKRVTALLLKLQDVKDPTTLSQDERRVWDAFANDPDPKKFKNATSKNRLRFQLGQRDRFIQGVFFSGRYLEDFENIFRENQLPIELTRLVFVESSFNVMARSKVGASGLWQIMRGTGRPYLMINDSIDKRNHPLEATRMAAKLLRSNYNMLESWPLAITGYNHGPSGVLRLTRLHKSRDLGEIAGKLDSKKKLGFASRNFYVSFLAALEAERKADYYFGVVRWSQPLSSVDIKLGLPITYKQVLKWFDNDDQRAQIFNPHITSAARKFGRPLPKGAIVSVPLNQRDQVQVELEELKKKDSRVLRRASSEEAPSTQEGLNFHSVRKGESLWTIAREYETSVKKLLQLNDLPEAGNLKVGQKIRVP